MDTKNKKELNNDLVNAIRDCDVKSMNAALTLGADVTSGNPKDIPIILKLAASSR